MPKSVLLYCMTDFGLGDNIINEEKLLQMMRWHGLFLPLEEENKEVEDGTGDPMCDVSDSGRYG